MRILTAVLVFIGLLLFGWCSQAAPCPHQENDCHQTLSCLETHASSYGKKVTDKAGSGAANVVTALSFSDVANGISDGFYVAEGPCETAAYGFFGGLKGLGKGVYRLGAGALEFITSPAPFIGPFRYPGENPYDSYSTPTPYGENPKFTSHVGRGVWAE